MASLLAELKRRNVIRVAVAYIVVGWVVLQVAEFLSPLLQLPVWTVPFALYLGILGFPFALIFAWAYELTPQGLRRTQDVDPTASITHVTGSMLNKIIFVLMAMATLLLLLDRFLPNSPPDGAAVPTTEINVGSAEELIPEKPKSIAVLPFVNMSNDPDQEYFSDGISEELLNALAKINELRVAARTSSFAFKGKNQDIIKIGNALNVETVLEGSVRKSGQRLRITAQLINVNDGYHLWSETYDRDLTDIFVIQDEISAAIVTALKVHLTNGEALASTRAVDLEAYNFFLLGRHSLRRRTEPSLKTALGQYQKAIDIDPNYAAAWVGKAAATALLSDDNYGQVPLEQAVVEAQRLLDRAFELDPDSGSAHATQALLYSMQSLHRDALTSVRRAIELTPTEGILYSWQFNALASTGEYNAALASLEQAYLADPLHQTIRHNLIMQYVYMGQRAKAREMVTQDSRVAYELEAGIAQLEGRWADAVNEYSRAIERSEGGYDYRMTFARSILYFFQLRNPELASPGVNERIRYIYQAVSDPNSFLARNPVSDFSALDIIKLTGQVGALTKTEQCPAVLTALAHKDFENTELYGDINGVPGDADLAIAYSWCLRQTGEQQQSLALARRIESYFNRAIANGEPPFYFAQLARVQMLLGEEDAAMGSLRLAWQYYGLDWYSLLTPEYSSLHSRGEYRELIEAVEQHTNAERAKLGWDPIEL
jgi:TolB-like protein